MKIKTEQYKNTTTNLIKVVLSILIGGLAGTLTMLLLAPKSEKHTGTQVWNKSTQLRDWTSGIVGDTISKVRLIVSNIANAGREKYLEIKQQSQGLAIEQLDHLSEAVKVEK